MKTPFPTIPPLPRDLNWESLAAIWKAFDSQPMREMQETWFPYAVILFTDLPETQITLSHFNELLHRFLLDLDPSHEYRQRCRNEYNIAWNEESRISHISYGDGFVHDGGFKLRAYSSLHDDNVAGWTGILFANHSDMRSQIYPVIRLAYEFSLWLQKQGINHSIILSKQASGQVEVDLPQAVPQV